MRKSSLPTAISSGCAVVLEPESNWPAEAFAAAGDCDRVVVIHADPTLSVACVAERIITHCSQFERSGAMLRSIILACAGCDSKSYERRLALVRALLPLLTFGEGQFVLTNDPDSGPSNQAVMELVGTLLSELQGRSITFLANGRQVPTPATRKDSGIYLTGPTTHRALETPVWLDDAGESETRVGLAS
jgi:hypothetical protein